MFAEPQMINKSISILCPECDTAVELGFSPSQGQIVTCSDCLAQLEVISTAPLELDLAAGDYYSANPYRTGSDRLGDEYEDDGWEDEDWDIDEFEDDEDWDDEDW